ncbi:DUF3429 domain-containing protein [Rhodobacteraceae bacterium 2376]|uniref:DUF3429 domain-containing protein n=1 Tax=Rhabdonatronobacter sediminivivens TaxID=2743469 RepID=A0A7Z0KY52_9RHOB|nr:DUF3429 domain-containing protein [Rhabdonatronobacter sediminivivens]NYS24201.1 DUF3429 domain-containing protein [Rhabdonatronobacter sediminivivens]
MIPRPALWLGLAGLLPFLWGVGTLLSPALAEVTLRSIGPRFVGPYVLIAYGTVILCFMSGVLWGFAARGEAGRWRGYALSVLPALWAFFFVGGGAVQALWALLTGFVVLLVMDMQFGQWGLTPRWWMRLRLILTAGVVACLALGLVLG